MTTKHLPPERRKEIATNAAKKRHDPNRGTRCCVTGMKFTKTNPRVSHQEYPAPICYVVSKMLRNVTRKQFEKICYLVHRSTLAQARQPEPVKVDLLRTPRAINSGE